MIEVTLAIDGPMFNYALAVALLLSGERTEVTITGWHPLKDSRPSMERKNQSWDPASQGDRRDGGDRVE